MSFRCGYCTLLGRPNVGKSTLINKLIGRKITITSRRPQTTRRNILGIVNWQQNQAIITDTPGLNQQRPDQRSQAYNAAALDALSHADVILALLDRSNYNELDAAVFAQLAASNKPKILIFNKIDRLEQATIDPAIEQLRQQQAQDLGFSFAASLSLSARKGTNLESLKQQLARLLPASPQLLFPTDMDTDQSEAAQVEELIREQVMRQMGDELPYSVQVQVRPWQLQPDTSTIPTINAQLICQRKSQKAMLIGKGGARIKSIGSKARGQIENLLQQQIMLKLQVKVQRYA